MQASFVTFLAEAWFNRFPRQKQERLFRTNPADNIIFSAMKALEDQAIVRVYETFTDEHNLHPIVGEIRRNEDLRLHRHAISHPRTVEWKDKRMQAFAEADRDGYDWRAAQLWDAQRSINEELRNQGRKLHNEAIRVTYDMAVSLHAILDLARKPEIPIPPVNELFTSMQVEVKKYQALLEKHPDGARDPEREKEAATRRQARKEKWAKQRAEKAATPTK
jgi:hypothetical protein